MPRRMALSDYAAKVLIKEVKKRGCLWDSDNNNYNDRYQMARAWSEISEVLHMPEECLRVKWKNMRDLFKKEIRKFGPTVEEYSGKWRHFEALAFLANTANGKVCENTEDNSSDKETVTKQEYIELDGGPEHENNEVQDYLEEPFEDPLPDKRPKMSLDDDYDVMFLKSLAPYFKQLDPLRKLVVRCKMQDMLLNEIAAQSATPTFQLKKS